MGNDVRQPACSVLPDQVAVDVYYLTATQLWRTRLTLDSGATVADALKASGVSEACHIDPFAHGLGIFGRRCTPEHRLADGDRVEIYRALVFDPMSSRRRRASHRKQTASEARARARERQ